MAKARATDKAAEATGGKAEGVNKSKAVREYLKAHRGVKPVQVAEALGKQGIIVSAGYVSTIKFQSKKRHRAVKAVVEKRGVSVPEIKAALALLKLSGSAAAAKEALAAAIQQVLV